MYRTFFIAALALLSCSPKIQQATMVQHTEGLEYQNVFEEWLPYMSCFMQEDSLLQDPRERIVFTGSSSIRMWGTLREDMADLPYLILNRGFGGSTMPDVNHYFDELIIPNKPALIVLYCGENDIAAGGTGRHVYEAFHRFLQLWKEKSAESKLLYVSMKPSPQRWGLWREFERGNKLIRDYIRQQSNPDLSYVDVGEIMLDKTTGVADSTIFINDLLHMNDQGYDRWEAVIYPEIKRMLNFKDEEDRAFATQVVNEVLMDISAEELFLSDAENWLTKIQRENQLLTAEHCAFFFNEKVVPKSAEVIEFIKNNLIEATTMAELEALSQACANPKKRRNTKTIESFNQLLDQQLQKVLGFMEAAIIAEIETKSAVYQSPPSSGQ